MDLGLLIVGILGLFTALVYWADKFSRRPFDFKGEDTFLANLSFSG
jgi:hypothetical protein